MMIKTLVTLLLAGLVATTAFGASDYPNYSGDTMGIFFDPNFSQEQTIANLFTPFSVYLVLLHPLSATNGFECTVTASGPAPFFALSATLHGVGAIDVDPSPNGFMVGCAADYVPSYDSFLLVSWQYMLTGPGDLLFFVDKATIPSLPGGLPVVTGGGVLRRCDVTAGDVHLPCACVNTVCRGMPVEASVFGSVKSLFR